MTIESLSQQSARTLVGALGTKVLRKLGLYSGKPRVMDSPRPLDMTPAEVFGEFTTDDGRQLPLYQGYRDRIKANWRLDAWPTIALMNVRDRIPLSAEANALVKALEAGATLPASLDQFSATVAQLARQYPHELIQSDIVSPITQQPVIAARLTSQQADSMAQYYRNYASATLSQYFCWHQPSDIETLSVLETGCGMGYAVAAMAALGVRRSVGIDAVERDYRCIAERPAVSERLGLSQPAIASRLKILPGDIHQLPFDNDRFDLIYSASVLEHIHDLRAAFAEMARVLVPGGIMIHSVDPYFSPRGGHASCTLDFPWGHVRLTPSEFRRYLQEFRPYEYEQTMDRYESLFNRPRVSLHEIEQFIGRAGLSVLSWEENWVTDHLPSNQIWQEANQIYPSIGIRDLAVNRLSLVLTKL